MILIPRVSHIYKLNTREDARYFHIHKIFGIYVLFHFAYRFYNFLTYPNHDMQFKNDIFTYFNIAIHALLSGSSLIFHIPNNRVGKAPMIWTEFRMHSIIFAYRSLIAMVICLMYYTNGKLNNQTLFNEYLVKTLRGVNVLSTIVLADVATVYYKKLAIRNNDKEYATTMRGMPFPSWTSSKMIERMNSFYSVKFLQQ